MKDNDIQNSLTALEVGSRQLGKTNTGYATDPVTGAEIIFALEAVLINGQPYSMRTGELLEWPKKYVPWAREQVGHFPLSLPGTGILIYKRDEKGDILLCLQRRSDLNQFGLFGGGLNPLESPTECAARELLEELAVTVKPEELRLLEVYSGPHHITRYPNGDIVLHTIMLFGIPFDKCKVLKGRKRDKETKSVVWMKLEELRRKLEDKHEREKFFPNNIPILEDIAKGKFSF